MKKKNCTHKFHNVENIINVSFLNTMIDLYDLYDDDNDDHNCVDMDYKNFNLVDQSWPVEE